MTSSPSPHTPGRPRGGGLALIEDGSCMVTLMGILGDHPPRVPEGFERFAADLALPDIHEIMKDAQPLDEPATYRYPASVRNRYDRLTRFPDGLAVLGDAVCTLNPIYGQGMTVAALEAAALSGHVADGLTRSYLHDVGRISWMAWAMALAADLSFPEVVGTRTPASRLLARYVQRVQEGAEHDAELGRAFLRMTSMVESPSALFRPSILLRASIPRSAAPHEREQLTRL